MAVHVDAQGSGYLVVADALRSGWQATVDGRPTDLVAADGALAAVAVPAGAHEVALRYVAPGLRTGIALTLGAAGLAVVLFLAGPWLDARLRRRVRTTEGDRA